jgi:hypothetical protein
MSKVIDNQAKSQETSRFQYTYRWMRGTDLWDGTYEEIGHATLWSSRPSDMVVGRWDESSIPPVEPEASVVLHRIAQIKKGRISPPPWEDVLGAVAAEWANSFGDFPACFANARRKLGRVYVAVGESKDDQTRAQAMQEWLHHTIRRLERIESEGSRILF